MMCVSSASHGFSWLKHHTMTQWLRSQRVHVKRLLNPFCKLAIEVFIRRSITAFALLSYSSSRSPCPSSFSANHPQRCHVLTPPPPYPWAAWQQPCLDALRLSGYVCPCRGPQQRLRNVGGRGRDTNQAELSWDSMSTAGPFQRQSGTTDQGGGMGSITFCV